MENNTEQVSRFVRNVKLSDVADYERVKKGKIYPAGTILFQLSATKGQLGYMETEGEAKTKDAALIARDSINTRYLFYAIRDKIPRFMAQYQTGLNLQLSALDYFTLDLEMNPDLQKQQAEAVLRLDKRMELQKSRIEGMKTVKKWLLQNSFPEEGKNIPKLRFDEFM